MEVDGDYIGTAEEFAYEAGPRGAAGRGLGSAMSQLALKRAAESPTGRRSRCNRSERLPVLCLHGWPQSSYMWRHLLPALASSGRRAVAPDLPGFGDSPPDPPGTWERHVEAVERFRRAIGLDRVVLVVHDTGARSACAGHAITRTPSAAW